MSGPWGNSSVPSWQLYGCNVTVLTVQCAYGVCGPSCSEPWMPRLVEEDPSVLAVKRVVKAADGSRKARFERV